MSATQPRTQAERRSATVEALLDATIDSLVEVGYVATTTRGVAARAGVSQGAQQHYFPTKAALVDAAMRRLLEQQLLEGASRGVDAPTELERAGVLLDRMWELHNLPVTPAIFELFNLARTDPQLACGAATLTGQGMKAIQALASFALQSYADRPGFADLIQITMATIRGTVLLAAIPGAEGSHPGWPAVRRHLLASLDALPVAERAK